MKSMPEKSDGAQGRNRTTDTAIFSRMLYQLSYLGGAAAADQTTRLQRGPRFIGDWLRPVQRAGKKS